MIIMLPTPRVGTDVDCPRRIRISYTRSRDAARRSTTSIAGVDECPVRRSLRSSSEVVDYV